MNSGAYFIVIVVLVAEFFKLQDFNVTTQTKNDVK